MLTLLLPLLLPTTLATPLTPPPPTCKFGTYRCTTPPTGIEICNVLGKWELVGACPKDTACENLPQNGYTLPFCTNTVTPATKTCTTPGKYECLGANAIQICNMGYEYEKVGECAKGERCGYLGGIPYCLRT
ncbi:hypothetical protein OQA88_8243 [Cercophora sp. LCS_1]